MASQTRDNIKELLQEGSVDESTVLAIVNAIYFKGECLRFVKSEFGIYTFLEVKY